MDIDTYKQDIKSIFINEYNEILELLRQIKSKEKIYIYNNNLNKREAIAAIIKNIKGKGLVLSKTRSITNYVETGVIVASVDLNATNWFESVQRTISVENKRNLNAYGSESEMHAIYDPILMLSGVCRCSR